mmetsp:Transcript_663/g.2163  ORF Transcript_663/g.2163 Transcript_663/m.2163 type:complete len:1123 (-) Transcript_663:1104-4472(-)
MLPALSAKYANYDAMDAKAGKPPGSDGVFKRRASSLHREENPNPGFYEKSKARTVHVVTKWPCCVVLLVSTFSLLLGAMGFLLGGVSIDTEGWETRGTPIAKAAIQEETWRTGQFTLADGTPAAVGTKDSKRRRARALLEAGDDDDEYLALETGSKSPLSRFAIASAMNPARAWKKRLTAAHDEHAALAENAKRAADLGRDPRAALPRGRAGGRSLLSSTGSCSTPYYPLPDDGNADTANDGQEYVQYRNNALEIIFYEGTNLFDVAGLKAMCEVEDTIMGLSGYSDYCDKSWRTCAAPLPSDAGWATTFQSTGSAYEFCYQPISLTRFLMSRLSLTSCNDFTASKQASVDTWVANYAGCADKYIVDATDKCSSSTTAGYYFDPAKFNAGFKTGSTKLTMTKSTFPMDTSKYDATMQWLLGLDKDGSLKLGNEYFSVAYSSSDKELLTLKTDEALMTDLFLATGSSIVITLLLWAHTGSLLLTLGGFLQIMMALPSAVFFQTVVCQITFFPFLNFLGVFVIAGIGADDCFVFYDKWMQAKSRMPPGASASEVAKECYWEAAWAMLLTSTTTAVAFASSAIIPIAPIRVFSIFMCAMVIFDYIYDITIFAAMLAWTHDASLRAQNNGGKGYSLICFDLFAFYEKRKEQKGSAKVSENSGLLRSKTIHQSAVPLPEKVLRKNAYPLLHAARWFLVVTFLAFSGVAAWQASKLTTPETNEVLLLVESDPVQKHSSLMLTGFLSSTESQLWVAVMFGLVPGDDGEYTDPTKRSSLMLDPTFEPTSTAGQSWFATFCSDTVSGMSTTSYYTPMDQFRAWIVAASGVDATSCGSTNPGWPLAASTVEHCMKYWADNHDTESQKFFYYPSSGEQTNANAKIFVLKASFAASVPFTSPLNVLLDEYDKWEAWVNPRIAAAPAGYQGGFQTSQGWWWMDTIDNMQRGAYSAAAITLGLAAAVILFGTGNVIVTVYSVTAIAAILCGTVASVIQMGWTLGFLEGICFSILIGLSVDFVIHIGHAYLESAKHYEELLGEKASRGVMAREALATMGWSVLSAAFTTMCSAVVLQFCTITFFVKFGTIIMLSTTIACGVTFFMFVPMLDAAGPTGRWGDMWAGMLALRDKLKKKN